jgi:sulfonate transport system ATP-binding protein
MIPARTRDDLPRPQADMLRAVESAVEPDVLNDGSHADPSEMLPQLDTSRHDRPTVEPAIEIVGVSKHYGPAGNSVFALDRISLTVGRGEFLCMVGASGCGKTTLLNLIAGLDRPGAGTITLDVGRPAFMFQEAALFPWLTASENIELPLKFHGVPRSERRDEVEGLLGLVHLTGFGEKRPHELSGGMRQRVALARALAQRAEVVLMDEPFGSLDAMTRDLLHDELERLWRERGLTIVFVTHDVREAVRLGDRIVLLTSRPGRVAEAFDVDLERPRQVGDPEVGEVAGHVLERLRQEVRRHATDR